MKLLRAKTDSQLRISERGYGGYGYIQVPCFGRFEFRLEPAAHTEAKIGVWTANIGGAPVHQTA